MLLLSGDDNDAIFAAIESKVSDGSVLILPDAGPATLSYRRDAELGDAWYAFIELDYFPPDICIEVEGGTYGHPTGIRIDLF